MIDFHKQLSIIPEVYETATLQDNLEHSGGISLSWKSKHDDEIALGSYVTYGGIRYLLMEPYAPTKQGVTHFQYNPTFKHPQALFGFIPFWIKSLDAEGNPIDLRTTSYTGFPYIIAQMVVDQMAEYANKMHDSFFAESVGLTWNATDEVWESSWMVNIDHSVDSSGRIIDAHTIISVGFDGCSIKGAADAIADAMGCNVFFDWSFTEYTFTDDEGHEYTKMCRTIRFVAGSTIQGEAFNCYHVLGGTTNMGKNTASGSFAAVTQRLTLDETQYPGSIISHAQQGGVMLTKELIFDDIYPKMELYICYAHQRLCYLTDNDTGEFIVDHWRYYYMSGDTKVYAEFDHKSEGKKYDADGHELTAEAVYKTFAKWYVRLSTDCPVWDEEHKVWNFEHPYKFDQSKLIDDKPLTLLFQMDYREPEHMSKLVGREFELTYFPDKEVEWGKTDVEDYDKAYATYTNGEEPDSDPNKISEFRIASVAEGITILPSTDDIELCPMIGDKVTLVNMALTDEKARAQQELKDAALEIIALMETPAGEYTETVILGREINGRRIDSVTIGQETPFEADVPVVERKHGPIVTQINHNLDTDVAEVTVGSWTRKTRTGGTADKVETVTVSANSSTEGGTPYSDGSIGLGGGYGGNSVETYEQTSLKPESMFVAGLSNTIDAVACDSNGKVKHNSSTLDGSTDVYTMITAWAGIKDVTASCIVSVLSLPPVQIGIFVTDKKGNETEIEKDNKGYELTDEKRWLRLNFPAGYDMSLLQDALTQMFYIEHPAYTEREVGIVIQAMREGKVGDTPIQAFQWNNSPTTAPTPLPSGATLGNWSTTAPNRPQTAGDHYLWMTQSIRHADNTYDTWSAAVRISGDKGDAGEDASDREYIYIRSNVYPFSGTQPKNVSRGKVHGTGDWIQKADQYTVDDYVPEGWSDTALPIEENNKYVYTAIRVKSSGQNQQWGDFTDAFLWSNWGVQGIDGDGVQYVYKLFDHELTDAERTSNIPTKPASMTQGEWIPTGWSDNPLAPTSSNKFCYCSIIKKIGGSWADSFEKLGLWSKWSDDGAPGGNTATVMLYKRSSSAVSTIGINIPLYYKFEKDSNNNQVFTDEACTTPFTNQTTGGNEWSPTIPSGTDDIYVVAAVAFSNTEKDIIRTSEWVGPVLYTENGAQGEHGINSAVVTLYRRATSSTALTNSDRPTGTFNYTFATGVLAANAGADFKDWSQNIPASNGYPCYVIQAMAISQEAVDNDVHEWNDVSKLVEDGKDGENAIVLDLDNEHEDFIYDDAGINKTGIVTSQARLHSGSEVIAASDVTWGVSVDGGEHYVESKSNQDGTEAKANITADGLLRVHQIYKSPAKVYMRARYPDSSDNFYYAVFTGNKTSQDKYDLNLNPNSIAYNSATYTTQAITIGGTRTDLNGNKSTLAFGTGATDISTVDNSGKIRLFVSYIKTIGGTAVIERVKSASFSVTSGTTGIAALNNSIYFELRRYEDAETLDSSTTGYAVCDYETIPINKAVNGKNGEDGKYTVTQYALSSSRTTHPSESSSDWSESEPTPTEQAPYVWQRTCVFNPNTSSYEGSWVYVCLTGETGEQGDAYTLHVTPETLVYNSETEAFVGGSRVIFEATHNGVSFTDGTLTVKGIKSSGYTNLSSSFALGTSKDITTLANYKQYVRFDATLIVDSVVVAACSVGITKYGDKGDKGNDGLQGCVVRVSEWKSGTTYRNDEGVSGLSVGYIDVAAIADSNETEGYRFYQVKKSSTEGTSRTTTEEPSDYASDWTRLTSVGPIFTSLLVAKNAYIKFGTGNQFVITDDNGYIQAGMKGNDSPDDTIRIWAGTNKTNPVEADLENAPFKVYKSGKMVATEGEFSGKITASTIQGNGVDVKSSDSATRYIRLKPSDTSIEGYSNNSQTFKLYTQKTYSQGQTQYTSAALEMGSTIYAQDMMNISDGNSSYILLYPSGGALLMVRDDSTKMFQLHINSNGYINITGRFAFPDEANTSKAGEIYKDGNGFLHVRLTDA